MKYLYWRGDSLWCRFPLPGQPTRFPLGIQTTGTSVDRRRCEREGEESLAAMRTHAREKTLFDIPEAPPKEKEYAPKFWRLVGRYWYYHLRFKKSGENERFHLAHSLRAFGHKDAKSINREDVELWRQKMVADGASVNTANNRFAYLQAVYSWANKESNIKKRLAYDPTIGLEKLPGGKVRMFVLTEMKFERNYALLRDGMRWPGLKPDKHCGEWSIPPDPRFSLFYLALWELGRRPNEVSQYTWEMVTTVEIDGEQVRYFSVSPELAKTDEPDSVVISDRLWHEMNQQAWRSGPVFLNAEGRPWRHWSRHKAKLEKMYGADCGWIRDTRRGFITHKTEVLGMDAHHVRMQSGHRTQSVFDRYRIGQLRNQASVVQSRKSTNQAHFAKVG